MIWVLVAVVVVLLVIVGNSDRAAATIPRTEG